jgi:aryl-alcohol dehydrogenase-like predicted oxidoreductase
MRMNQLGRTGIEVSQYCLGSMTWGNQTRSAEAHKQIDAALANGLNFVDTAEMYPVNPMREETIGRTERIIGLWMEKTRGHRSEIVLATKHSGEGMMHTREGAPISAATIPAAIEGSLRRLKTDYVDLYQFHWPNRGSYHFRQNWQYDPSAQNPRQVLDNMSECLLALEKERKRGTIRAFGLSNETAWGMAQWLRIAEGSGWLRAATIQNEYSLLCRTFDTDLAELCANESVGLLAFSPLAAGLLTGKYQGRAKPKGSRITLSPDLGGRKTARVFPAIDDYIDVAFKHDLDVVHMCLAWAAQRPFTTSVIFGATTFEQMEHVINGLDLTLSAEVLSDLDVVHKAHPMPF